MNTAEVLDDLNERIDRGLGQLDRLRLQARDSLDAAIERSDEEREMYWRAETLRLAGKAEGLRVVRDWLRAYTPPKPSPMPDSEEVSRERVDSAFGPALVVTYEDGTIVKVFDPS